MRLARTAGMLLLVVAALHCEGALEEGKPDDEVPAGKEDRWNWQNDPDRFDVPMNRVLAELPSSGAAERSPWSETWWPMRKDGFNQRWQRTTELSPLEKYDVAFNGWTPPAGFDALTPFSYPGSAYDEAYYEQLGPAAKWESENGGNRRARNGVDDDGDGETDETADWDGLGGWWGKCHMWSAVAVLADEPQHAVTVNGVTFEYSDITALVMATFYNRSRSYMLGDRCNDQEIARDENGRPTNISCRDTNAGSFHVIVTNMLGVHKRAFVMDKASDAEVWNHPISDFEVTLSEAVEVAEACRLLGLGVCTEYPYNPDASAFQHVRLTLGYVSDGVSPSTTPHGMQRRSDSYEYILELDNNGEIIGGEWIFEEGPDFFWLPVMNTYSRGGNPHLELSKVENLLRLSRQTDEPVPAGDQTTVAAEIPAPIAIPDDDATGITSGLDVAAGGTAGSVEVAVRITHTFVGDLRIDLRHGERTARLYSGAGGSEDDIDQVFSVPDLQGVDVGGRWELIVRDEAGQDTGTLDAWSLTYTLTTEPPPDPNRRTVTGGSTTRADIPDDDPNGIASTATIAETGVIRGLVLAVDIRHTYSGDLTVSLEHLGTSVTVHNRAGGSADDIVREFTVADFDGTDVQGEWKLLVTDTASRDTGALASWGITATVE